MDQWNDYTNKKQFTIADTCLNKTTHATEQLALDIAYLHKDNPADPHEAIRKAQERPGVYQYLAPYTLIMKDPCAPTCQRCHQPMTCDKYHPINKRER